MQQQVRGLGIDQHPVDLLCLVVVENPLQRVEASGLTAASLFVLVELLGVRLVLLAAGVAGGAPGGHLGRELPSLREAALAAVVGGVGVDAAPDGGRCADRAGSGRSGGVIDELVVRSRLMATAHDIAILVALFPAHGVLPLAVGVLHLLGTLPVLGVASLPRILVVKNLLPVAGGGLIHDAIPVALRRAGCQLGLELLFQHGVLADDAPDGAGDRRGVGTDDAEQRLVVLHHGDAVAELLKAGRSEQRRSQLLPHVVDRGTEGIYSSLTCKPYLCLRTDSGLKNPEVSH